MVYLLHDLLLGIFFAVGGLTGYAMVLGCNARF